MSILMEPMPPQSQSSPPPPPSPQHENQTETSHSPVCNQLQLVTVPPANELVTVPPPANEEKNDNQYDYRFQRTDQWMPVYSWLESLDTDELVKSNDISDWLTANPEIREHLSSRHSKYHLMHYIKKCHMKILKKKDKNKGMLVFGNPENMETRLPVSVSSTGIPEDPEMFKTRHKEAFEKYKILVEFEKRLLAQFPPKS